MKKCGFSFFCVFWVDVDDDIIVDTSLLPLLVLLVVLCLLVKDGGTDLSLCLLVDFVMSLWCG